LGNETTFEIKKQAKCDERETSKYDTDRQWRKYDQ